MADHLEYPVDFDPHNYARQDSAPTRPAEPWRPHGPSAPPMGAARVSTATWISASQFPASRRIPVPPERVYAPAPASIVESLPEPEPYQFRQEAPRDTQFSEDSGRGYVPPAPPTDAEHMTIDVDAGEHYPQPPVGGQPPPKPGVGGFLRRVLGIESKSRPGTAGFGNAQELQPASAYAGGGPQSFAARHVTYVDTNPTLMPYELRSTMASAPERVPSAPASVHGSGSEHRRRYGSAHTSSAGEGSVRGEEPEGAEERPSHETAVDPEAAEGPEHGQRDLEGTTAAHHGPFMGHGAAAGVPQSPVYHEPLPTSDYDKMSAFHTAPSELHSLFSYVDRVTQFMRDLNDLPWVSSRVAADYIPGESSRSKYFRFKQRHSHGSLGVNSWYARPGHRELDLLEGEGSQVGPHRPHVAVHASPNNDYMHPGAYPYAPPRFDVDPPPRSDRAPSIVSARDPDAMSATSHRTPPRTAHSSQHWSDGVGLRVESASSPSLPPASMHQTPQTVAVSFASPRTDRTNPTLSHTAHSFASPRTDATTVTAGSGTAAYTARGSRRERGTDAGTAGSDGGRSMWRTVTERDARRDSRGSGTGTRRSRVSWYSSGDGSPVNAARPLSGGYSYGAAATGSPPGSPPARDGGRTKRTGGAAPQMVQMPGYLLPVPEQPTSPPRSVLNSGSPRRNRQEHQHAGNGYAPDRQPIPFALPRG